MSGGAVALVDLHRTFGELTAVDHLNLTISPGEFFSLLGPSGCGKSTTLRLIAGFERPTSGQVLIDGVDMSNTPPHLRPVNTVFQSYALFPHLSVGDNVAFGLKYQTASKEENARRVAEALEMVRLGGFEKRKPHQLSGGQQQRVALARSLVLNPSVLLLDEPLGALDAKLRKALQVELKGLQEEVGITFIYVTHDQEEALTMSDRLAVMSAGLIEQVGTPAELYERPQSSYVADFLGLSNLLDATVIGPHPDGGCLLDVGGHQLLARAGAIDARRKGPGLDQTGTGRIEPADRLGRSGQLAERFERDPQPDDLHGSHPGRTRRSRRDWGGPNGASQSRLDRTGTRRSRVAGLSS